MTRGGGSNEIPEARPSNVIAEANLVVLHLASVLLVEPVVLFVGEPGPPVTHITCAGNRHRYSLSVALDVIRDFFETFIVLKKGYDADFAFLENIRIKV